MKEITLKLDSKLADQLETESRNSGINPEDLVVEWVREQLERPIVFPDNLGELIQKISLGETDNFWQEFNLLKSRAETDTLSDEDIERLIEMTDRVELLQAERLEKLAELAVERNISPLELIKSLDFMP